MEIVHHNHVSDEKNANSLNDGKISGSLSRVAYVLSPLGGPKILKYATISKDSDL